MFTKKDIILSIVKCAVAMTLFVIAIVNYDTLSTIDVVSLVSFTDKQWFIILVVLGIYLLKALVFVVPASLVYVAVGMVLPKGLAVAVNLIGILIEVCVTYLLGHFLGYEAVKRMLEKKPAGKKLLEKNIQNNPAVILGIRAVPAFPIDFVSLFYGASGCKFWQYAVLSVVGISWRVILFTIIGSEVFDWIPIDKIVLIVICFIPVGVVWYLVKKFYLPKRKAKKEQAQSE
ncbi:MAG: VTT domain-containing protein [Ruminococcaceae bacterium]|nr:VTT domain-containing protein [Oscillospiraceae bacterium]